MSKQAKVCRLGVFMTIITKVGPAFFWCLGFALTLFSTTADAQERILQGLGGSDTVFVWTDKKAHDEALKLINAGVHKSNPSLILPLVACMVPSGTKAIITSAGFATHDIMVTSGPSSGCRGNIPMEAIRR